MDSSEIAWKLEGACTQSGDPELFFPVKSADHWSDPAKKICYSCPVFQACGEYALKNREPHGVWGGMSERFRRALLAKHDRARAARQAELSAALLAATTPQTVTESVWGAAS